jgi:hypothetical protein
MTRKRFLTLASWAISLDHSSFWLMWGSRDFSIVLRIVKCKGWPFSYESMAVYGEF